MLCISRGNNKKAGFTLIEMMVVAVALAIISLTLFSVFNNGLKIWQRANQQSAYEDLNISFEKFVSDIRNSFNFSKIPFSGQENVVSFATLVESPRLQNKTVGCVEYSYDPTSSILYRIKRDYSQVYNDDASQTEVVLSNIKSLKFQYYYYDKKRKEYAWADGWAGQAGLPIAVRLELYFEGENDAEKFIKTVNIPAGG